MMKSRVICLIFAVLAATLLSACFGKYYDYPYKTGEHFTQQDIELDHRGQPFLVLNHEYSGVNYHDFKVCMDPDGPLRLYVRKNSFNLADWRTDPEENGGACLVCTAERILLPVSLAKAKGNVYQKMAFIAGLQHERRKNNRDFRVMPAEFCGEVAAEFFAKADLPTGDSLSVHGFMMPIPDMEDVVLEVMYIMTEKHSSSTELYDLGEQFLKSVKFR